MSAWTQALSSGSGACAVIGTRHARTSGSSRAKALATDASRLRQIGMVVYGFEPFRLSEEDDRSHGDDERLSVENVRFGLEVTYALVLDVAGTPAGR